MLKAKNIYASLLKISRLVFRNIISSMILSPAFILSQLATPLFYIYVAGIAYMGMISHVSWNGLQLNYLAFMVPGIIVSQYLMISSVAGGMFWIDKRLGMLERILCGPFSKFQYIISQAIAVTFQGMVFSSIVMIVAFPSVVKAMTLTFGGVLFILCSIFFGGLFFGSLALALCAIIRSQEHVNALLTMVITPLMFLSSVFYPPDVAPTLIVQFIWVNPLSHAANTLRAGMYNAINSMIILELIALIIEATLMLGIAILAMREKIIEMD